MYLKRLLIFIMIIFFEISGFSASIPMRKSLRNDDIRYYDYLIARGDNVNTKTESGSYPLHIAVGAWAYNITKLLLEKGADVDAKDEQGFTPLHKSAALKDSNELSCKIAKLLIEYGADVNNRRKPGFVSRYGGNNTPLHEAVWARNLPMVKLLVENGADVNAKNNQNYTPLHEAAKSPNPEFVFYLILKGADVNAICKDRDCPTPIFNAAADHIKTLEVLIKNGADLKIKNKQGLNVLEWAERINRPKIVEFLWPYFYPNKPYKPKSKPSKGLPPFR